MDKALVIRYGAIGDHIMMTPVYRELKQLGYYVIANVSERGIDVLKNNPHIDEFISHKRNSVPNEELDAYWDKLVQKVRPDYYRNFTESVEVDVLFHQKNEKYYLPQRMRQVIGNTN